MKKCKLLAAFLAAALAVSSIPCAAFAETVSDIDLPALESIETNPTDSGDHATGGAVDLVFEQISDEEGAEILAALESCDQQETDEVDFEYSSLVSEYFSYDYSNNYIYKQLDDTQKKWYGELYNMAYEAVTTPKTYPGTVVSNNLKLTPFAGLKYSDFGYSATYVKDAMLALCFTNPQFFFLSFYVAYDSNYIFLYMWGDYYDGQTRMNAVNNIAEQTAPLVANINAASSLMEKEEAVYEIVCNNLTYDFDSLAAEKNGDASSRPYTQTILGMFYKNTTVCAGYAATFNYLCNLTGIEAIQACVWGNHQWNMVNLYGNWYVIDTTGTWMDKDEKGYDYNFCNKSLAYIQSLSDQSREAHTPDTYSGISLPDCNKNDYYIYLSASQDNDNYLGSLTSILDNYEDDYNWIWDYYVEGAPIHATSYGVYGYSPVGWNLYEWNPSTSEWYYTETVYGEQLNLTANKNIAAFAIYQPIDETAVSNFVERLYTKMLNRPSEAAGKADWVSKIMNGATATDVASGFVLSEELKNQNLSNPEFVTRMYRTFMDRDPDESGLADWVNALDNGCSYAYVLNSFVLSAEFGNICKSTGINTGSYELTEARDKNRNLTAFVSRMYTKALGRAYEVEGLNYWTGRVFSGDATLNALAHGFIFSGEFKNKNLSDSAFVDTLYVTFFDRPADATGKADWLNRMHYQGYTREQVLDGFLGAEEFGNLVKSFGL